MELHLDASSRDFAVGGEINEVLFLDRELPDLGLELLTKKLLCLGFVGNRSFKSLSHRGDEVAAELKGLVVGFNRVFDALKIGVGRVADMVLHSSAEEIGVLTTVSPGGSHDDHALDDLIFEAAASAPECALEVMVILDTPFARLVPGIEECLDLFKQFRVDQRVVPTFEGLALVLDLTEVVAVTQHPLHFRDDDWRSGSCRGRAGRESPIGEFGSDVIQSVLTSGIELEREFHEGGALCIYRD